MAWRRYVPQSRIAWRLPMFMQWWWVLGYLAKHDAISTVPRPRSSNLLERHGCQLQWAISPHEVADAPLPRPKERLCLEYRVQGRHYHVAFHGELLREQGGADQLDWVHPKGGRCGGARRYSPLLDPPRWCQVHHGKE